MMVEAISVHPKAPVNSMLVRELRTIPQAGPSIFDAKTKPAEMDGGFNLR